MRHAWLAAVALALLAGPAYAQPTLQPEACRAPILSVERPPVHFDPGSSRSLLMVIENPNRAPVDSVRATITTTAPAGWTAIPAQRELTLGPRNFSLTPLALTAPNRGSGASEGNVTVLVTFVCTSGDIQTSASAAEVVGVALRPFEAPWPLVLGAFALLAGGVIILGVRRLRRSTAILPLGADRDVAPGHSVKFTFVVENRRGKPQRLRLSAEGLPEGWSIHLALVDLELEPGEEKKLWAILKAPPLAQPGTDLAITLRLTGARGAEAASATLHAHVTGT
ncbi:MAG TPA: hypothetical protein VFH78_06210 [Candidatus Thermoplasmatota archaeon]|nr:hypothetical protein [Candidatus Thermoplasmatota archaeon]